VIFQVALKSFSPIHDVKDLELEIRKGREAGKKEI
jgi:hypothetical protein